MIEWAIIFAIIALVAGVLGFSGLAGAAMGIAQILFWIAVVIAVIFRCWGSPSTGNSPEPATA